MDEELRSRIRIQYVDSYGEVEAGVDGGGLFKDFMENLVREGFNPDVGLFRTTAEHKLYPNPAAAAVVPNAQQLFEFMGKMLGKAMYEVSRAPHFFDLAGIRSLCTYSVKSDTGLYEQQ